LSEPDVALVEPVLPAFRPPASPRGTACPVLPDPPRRRCSAASARSGRIGARSRTGAPTHGAGDEDDPAFDDPPPAVEELPPPDELDGAGALDPPSPPPPRGTAEPTVSPFEGRDDCCSP
jgi:hypothetical protein